MTRLLPPVHVIHVILPSPTAALHRFGYDPIFDNQFGSRSPGCDLVSSAPLALFAPVAWQHVQRSAILTTNSSWGKKAVVFSHVPFRTGGDVDWSKVFNALVMELLRELRGISMKHPMLRPRPIGLPRGFHKYASLSYPYFSCSNAGLIGRVKAEVVMLFLRESTALLPAMSLSLEAAYHGRAAALSRSSFLIGQGNHRDRWKASCQAVLRSSVDRRRGVEYVRPDSNRDVCVQGCLVPVRAKFRRSSVLIKVEATNGSQRHLLRVQRRYQSRQRYIQSLSAGRATVFEDAAISPDNYRALGKIRILGPTVDHANFGLRAAL